MRAADIPFAVQLSDQENWGTTRNDFSRLLRLNPSGCFIAYEGTKRVGLTTATLYGKTLAWIGNVIVDRHYRGKSIGPALVEHAVTFIERSRVRHVALYCFAEHVRFYERLGFVRDAQFFRMRRRPRSVETTVNVSVSHPAPSLTDVLRADKLVFGADRSRLVRDVLDKKAGWYIGSIDGNGHLCYLFVREYADMCEIGPWACIDPPRGEAKMMLSRAIREVGTLPVEASCLRMNRDAHAMMTQAGFRVIREGYRMFLESRARIGNDRAQFALGFLDKG